MNEVADDKAGAKAPALTRKALNERVQAATGAKMGDVRTITEAVLQVLGAAVRSGETLRLPPFGLGRPRAAKEGAESKSVKMIFKAAANAPEPKAPKATKPAKPARAAKAGGGGKGKRAGKKASGGVETPAASE